tara:strand:+ start:1199 stop:1738 length:540 start_codon:yes stop_codon:yes gene_type:complete
MGKAVSGPQGRPSWESDIRFWNQAVANKDSHAGYRYAYEMAKNHYHGGGSPWAQGAGAKAKRYFAEWKKHDDARKEQERHAKAVGVAQESAKVKLLGDLERLKLEEQANVQKKKAQVELMKQAKKEAKRAQAQAQFAQVTRPRLKVKRKSRSPSPRPKVPDFAKIRPRRASKDSLTSLW